MNFNDLNNIVQSIAKQFNLKVELINLNDDTDNEEPINNKLDVRLEKMFTDREQVNNIQQETKKEQNSKLNINDIQDKVRKLMEEDE